MRSGPELLCATGVVRCAVVTRQLPRPSSKNFAHLLCIGIASSVHPDLDWASTSVRGGSEELPLCAYRVDAALLGFLRLGAHQRIILPGRQQHGPGQGSDLAHHGSYRWQGKQPLSTHC